MTHFYSIVCYKKGTNTIVGRYSGLLEMNNTETVLDKLRENIRQQCIDPDNTFVHIVNFNKI